MRRIKRLKFGNKKKRKKRKRFFLRKMRLRTKRVYKYIFKKKKFRFKKRVVFLKRVQNMYIPKKYAVFKNCGSLFSSIYKNGFFTKSAELNIVSKLSYLTSVNYIFKKSFFFIFKHSRYLSSFYNLYFFFFNIIKKSHAPHYIKKKAFNFAYSAAYLIFFKSFFYLDVCLFEFFKYNMYKKHRSVLILLKRYFNNRTMIWFNDFGLFGLLINFYGKFTGFGGSKKKKYSIRTGLRASMNAENRTYVNLYEYNTQHGRIGSKVIITTRCV